MPVVGKQTVRVAGYRELVKKGKVYPDDHPIVNDRPELFESPGEHQEKHQPATNTTQLGNRSMSARKVERATQAPGEKRDVDIVCPDCGFEAATPAGLGAHQRSHKE